MRRPWLLFAFAALALAAACAQSQWIFNSQEQPIAGRIGHLDDLPDAGWTVAVGQLARQIQALPPNRNKARLAVALATSVTGGDAGRETLETVADTLVSLLGSVPAAGRAELCRPLAILTHYEHVRVRLWLDDPDCGPEMEKLEAADRARLSPEFTLRDLQGKEWSLSALRGKVVMVNFWTAWCVPCTRQLPDLQALYERFGPRGLAILAVSGDEPDKLRAVAAAGKYTFPVLLDPHHALDRQFALEGIPKTFVYGRDGKLVAQAIDRRTNRQFLGMLKLAGLE